jgi:hypothetical protein
MSLLGRIRASRAASPVPAPAVLSPVSIPAITGVELAEDELEQVVGGLERIYVPGLFSAD